MQLAYRLNPRLRYLSANPDAVFRLEIHLAGGRARVVRCEAGVATLPADSAWLALRPPGCETHPDAAAIDAYLAGPAARRWLEQIRNHYRGGTLGPQGLIALLNLQSELWALPGLPPDRGYWFAPEWLERHPPVGRGEGPRAMTARLIAEAARQDVLLDWEEVYAWVCEECQASKEESSVEGEGREVA